MKIEGLSELLEGLARESALADRRAAAAVARTGQLLDQAAAGLAPRRTGALASSIESTISGTRAEVGPTVPYGGFVERGTYKDPAQPYMGPAAEQHEEDLARELLREVGEL